MNRPLEWICIHTLDLDRIRAYLDMGICDKLAEMIYNLSNSELQAEDELEDIIKLAKEGQEVDAWEDVDIMDVDELTDELQEALDKGQGITLHNTMRLELLLDLFIAIRDKSNLLDFINNAQKWRELLTGETLGD